MNANFHRKHIAQLIVVLLCALAVKLFYSTASVNELRWILTPTTFLVELISGSRFEFESYSGYVNGDHSFVIAASCAGVNFLLTAFLMLSLSRLWRHRSQEQAENCSWLFIPVAAVFAYLTTLVANTVRISTALQMRAARFNISWLSPEEVHRLEGIVVYFGFLLLLFIVSDKVRTGSASDRMLDAPGNAGISPVDARSQNPLRLVRQFLFPLLIYYVTTLGIPLANAAYRSGTPTSDFWEHLLFVLITPLILILPLAAVRWKRFTT